MKKIILIAVVLLVIFFYFNGALILTRLRFSPSKYPLLYQTPVVRELSCPSFAAGSLSSELSYYGIILQAPWPNIVDRKENQGSAQIVFENNKHIVIFDEKEGIKDTLLQGDPGKADKIKAFFGDGVIASNYAFYDALLSIKPVFFSFKNPAAKSILLVLKASIVPPFSSGNIYSFNTGAIKGFQFGDPSSRLLVIEFFDINDQMHSIAVSGASQQDVDCILSSITIL